MSGSMLLDHHLLLMIQGDKEIEVKQTIEKTWGKAVQPALIKMQKAKERKETRRNSQTPNLSGPRRDY